jgi:hypothetical protein
MLTQKQLENLHKNGFIKIDGIVCKETISLAKKSFNRWRHELLVGNRKLAPYESVGICYYCHAYKNAPFMNELRSIATKYAEFLLGEGNCSGHGDGALMGWPPAFESHNERQLWHLDGVDKVLASPHKNHFPQFQLAICFPLLNVENMESGGLAVWPGQHNYISEVFKNVSTVNEGLKIIQEKMYSSYPPCNSESTCERIGDIIIFNALLPHGTFINKSSDFADKVYFRFGYGDPQNRVGIKSCREPWQLWSAMREF